MILWSIVCSYLFFFCKQKTAYEMRISDWSSDVCSSDLGYVAHFHPRLVGLTGTAEQIAAAQVVFGVHADRSPAAANGSYLMNHSLLTFLLGRDGRHLETFLSGSEPEAMAARSEEHTSELQSLMRTSYAVFSLTKKK